MSSRLDADQCIQAAFDDASGTLNISPLGGSLVSEVYDYLAVTYPTTASEQYVYKSGGVGGTTVATVLVTYTDATKTVLTSVAKT